MLAAASEIFGSREAAQAWLAKPAPALDQHRPIDLIATPPGYDEVMNLLQRLRYGVYT